MKFKFAGRKWMYDNDFIQFILNCQYIDGIYFDGTEEEAYRLLKDKGMCRYDVLWDDVVKYPECEAYIDEPLNTAGLTIDGLKKFTGLYNNLCLGEIPYNRFVEINSNYPSIKLTYTSYSKFWFRIFGLNICFGNVLSTWEKLQKDFPHQFDSVWIHSEKNKNQFTELTSWAKEKDLKIYLYAGGETDKNHMLENLNKFIDAIRSV